MKRIIFIILFALSVPVVSLQRSGVNILQETADASHAVLKMVMTRSSEGSFKERGKITEQPRLNDRRNHYYRVHEYTIEDGKIVRFEEPKAEKLDDTIELVVEEPEFEAEKEEFVEEAEYVYDDEGLGSVPDVGEISESDLEEEKKRDAVNDNVEFGGFNL